MSHQRIDLLGKSGNVERTPSGGVRVPANLTRTGVFRYYQPDGSVVRELRTPEEVFDSDSLESLADAPVTVGHPNSVTPDTWRRDAVGHVRDIKRDGRFVGAKVVIQDGDTVAKVLAKDLVELSCGYSCEVVQDSGTYEGEAYDARQTNIRYNHVAMGGRDWGRAGPEVRLKLDSAYSDPCVISDMPSETITDSADLAALRQDRDTARGERDALKSQVTQLEKDLATARADASEDRIDARVQARVSLLEKARKVVDNLDSKMSDVEILNAVLKKDDSSFDGKGQSLDYLRARFDLVTERYAKTADELGAIRSPLRPAPRQDEDVVNNKKLRENAAKAWTK